MESGRSYQDYIEALEEERKKIMVFQRELPLCLELVNHAIDSCKRQRLDEETRSEEDTCSDGPVLEEFIQIRRDEEEYEEEEEDDDDEVDDLKMEDYEDKKDEEERNKMEWLRSTQLWGHNLDDRSLKDQGVDLNKKCLNLDNKRKGAFHPFNNEKKPSVAAAATAASSMAASSTTTVDGKEGESQRKTRRCWSPELHQRFLHALQQLGGAQVATPKQIKELMKVDGLTNDEVKSHLQKYRLHTRRMPSPTIPVNNPQPAQFVVVGGIWVPPEYASAANGKQNETTITTIYTPIATPAAQRAPLPILTPQPAKRQCLQPSPDRPVHSQEGSGCRVQHSVGEDRNSSTMSSSSRTTSSPAM